jgi:phospholipid transport system substrate-binding protein
MRAYRISLKLLAIWLFFIAGSAHAATGPMAQVQDTIDHVVALLRDKNLQTQDRRDQIRKLINERFYFKAMSQRTLSRNWRKATPEQQDRFTDLFAKLLEKTYMGRIEAYTDEKVEYIREKMETDTRAMVYTQILAKSGNIPINYRVAKKGDQWLVYDVIIEEVSLISNYRSSYEEIIKKDGIEGLLSQMAQKVKDQETEKSAAG